MAFGGLEVSVVTLKVLGLSPQRCSYLWDFFSFTFVKVVSPLNYSRDSKQKLICVELVSALILTPVCFPSLNSMIATS